MLDSGLCSTFSRRLIADAGSLIVDFRVPTHGTTTDLVAVGRAAERKRRVARE